MDTMNPLLHNDDTLYFVAQTGVWKIRRFHVPSNFHVYELPYEDLARVQAAVRDAKVTYNGLEYPADFLRWLEHNDKGDYDA